MAYLGLHSNVKKGLQWALWISLAVGTYFFILYGIILKNEMNLHLGFNVWLNHILLVGFTEELVFRGLFLRKLMERLSFWKANRYTSLLFVSIHFPIWLRMGLFESWSIIGTIILAFFISFALGFIYKKTNSLWSVIIIHSAYDLFASIFG